MGLKSLFLQNKIADFSCTKCYSFISRKIFKTHAFSRWMKKAALTDADLCAAVIEMSQGLIDADLGGHIVKKRVAQRGQGKRGSTRTIVATKTAERWFFIYGFNKNERANIGRSELKALQEVAKTLLEFNEAQLAIAMAAGQILEVYEDGNTKT